jgi:sporulation integral membrane protein YtvI
MNKSNRAVLNIISIILFVMILLKLCLVFLSPFIISVILVIIIEPFVKFINNFKVKRRISVMISFALLSGILVFVIYYLSSITYSQINSLLKNLPDIFALFKTKFKFMENVNYDYAGVIKTIENIIPKYKEKIIGTIISTANGAIYIIIISMTTLLLSIDLYKIASAVRKYLPMELCSILSSSFYKINKIINTEIRLVAATTLLIVIGLYVLGANKPLTVGIICGILDLIPIVGPSLIFIPWIVYSILVERYFFAIGLLFLNIAIQICRGVMEIKFVGKSLKIHPLVTIFSLYIGIIVYGVWGVIFGPLIVIIIREIIDKYSERGYRLKV